MQESKLQKTYNPKDYEQRIYKEWINRNYFHAETNSAKPKYSILMPPPNITGKLHVGHALNHTIPDIIARYKRMMGYNVAYIPGTDHASIATEDKVVSKLLKMGIKREDLTREEFNKYIEEWYVEYAGIIIEQIKSLGISADWERHCFTRDEERNKAVTHAFVDYWNKGLIYRGERLTNWCPHCKTAISDIEVEYNESKSKLYYIKYYLENSTEFLIVATTRPETLFGDLAVAVNPSDERYKKFKGQKVILPILNKLIPIIQDEYVDIKFGTGALKVTPSHDINDYNLGKKHHLGFNNIMEKNGSLNEKCGQFKGLKGFDARNKVVEFLKSHNLLIKEEDYTNNVGQCCRCHNNIESLITEQWYLDMKKMVVKTKKAIKNQETELFPKSFKKNMEIWLKDVQDWCISRQLWSGHRIPVYYCNSCKNIFANEKKTCCPKCKSTNIIQDEDVLDTWFSSGIWPISTLGGFEDKPEFKEFYPYDLVITGYDIIFFWIARMLFMGEHFTNQVSLKNIVLTGLLRDEQGRKMSKNLGNGIDPSDVINKYGADVLRYSLVYGNTLEGDSRFGDSKIEISRHFINKIWNAGRFLEMNLESKDIKNIDKCKLSLADKWILHELNQTVNNVQKLLKNFEVGIALSEIYDFAWSKFCDYYIEFSKPNMQNENLEVVNSTASVLKYVYEAVIKLLHPFIPFITEELWTIFNNNSITFEKYPMYNENYNFMIEKEQMTSIMELTREIRKLRNQYKVDNKKELNAKIFVRKTKDNLSENISYLQNLTNTIVIETNKEQSFNNDMVIATTFYILYLNGEEVVNKDEERLRLKNEIIKNETDLNKIQGLLNNEGFLSKAPNVVVEKYKKNIDEFLDKKDQLEKALKMLN